jgi:hypothetical protein
MERACEGFSVKRGDERNFRQSKKATGLRQPRPHFGKRVGRTGRGRAFAAEKWRKTLKKLVAFGAEVNVGCPLSSLSPGTA